MNRLYKLFTFIFVIGLFFFFSTDAHAQDKKVQFHTTDKLYLQVNGGEKKDLTKSLFTSIVDNLNPAYKDDIDRNANRLKQDMNRAIENGTWLYVQRFGSYKGKSYAYYSLYFNYSKNCDVRLDYRGDIFYLDTYSDKDECRFRSAKFDAGTVSNYYGNSKSYTDLNVQISFETPDSKAALFFYTGDYTLTKNAEPYIKQDLPRDINQASKVKLPIFISSTDPKSQKPNVMDLSASLNVEAFKKLNPDVPELSFLDMRLYKDGDQNKEVFGQFSRKGLLSEWWSDVEYGNYRLIAMGFYHGENAKIYRVQPAVIDFKVDDKGFWLNYDANKDQTCVFRQGASTQDINHFSTDPNTGSWISPGSTPERCFDNPWDKSPDSEFKLGYDFDKLVPCKTMDLACHMSRFFNAITKWVFGTISWLFFPDSARVGAMFNQTLSNLQRSFGFLFFPVTFISDVFKSILQFSAVNDTCALPPISIYGSTATIELCRWRYQLPGTWSFMQLIIRAGISIAFLWVCYRLLMRFLGVQFDDADDAADDDVDDVRWRDDRTGETGDWERRRK